MKSHKILLILSFTLLFVVNIFGQPMLDIPLYATDGTYTILLSVGIDPTATNGIDTQFGESDLPPFPPGGAFEIRFDLLWYTGENLSSYKDYRFANIPYWVEVEHRLWWQVSYTFLPITIQYNFPNGVFMFLRDELGGVLFNIGPLSGQGIATIPGEFTVFNHCLLIIDYMTPVELTSFKASVLQDEKAVQLNWTTATETNNSGFIVERMSVENPKSEFQNSNWTEIGFVPGFGTTTEPKSYSFTDKDVTTGVYKYRLKQIDFDGSFTYSNEIEVEVDFTPKEFVLYQNYPNPFNPSTAIKYSLPVESFVRINIYNALGEIIEELVSKVQDSGNYEVTWNAQNYSSGIYYYSFEVNSADGSQSQREMKKIVFLK